MALYRPFIIYYVVVLGKLYIVRHNINIRLREMGLVQGAKFQVIDEVNGMCRLRLFGSDIVIRKETLKEIEYVAV